MTTQTAEPQIRHLIGEKIAAADLRTVHEPGRVEEVMAQVAVGTAGDVGFVRTAFL